MRYSRMKLDAHLIFREVPFPARVLGQQSNFDDLLNILQNSSSLVRLIVLFKRKAKSHEPGAASGKCMVLNGGIGSNFDFFIICISACHLVRGCFRCKLRRSNFQSDKRFWVISPFLILTPARQTDEMKLGLFGLFLLNPQAPAVLPDVAPVASNAMIAVIYLTVESTTAVKYPAIFLRGDIL